jgi:hypothetical protein
MNTYVADEQATDGHGTRAMPIWEPILSQVAWEQDLGRVRAYNLAKYIDGLQAK